MPPRSLRQSPFVVRLRSLLWQWRGVLIATPGVAGVVIGLRLLGLLQMWELAAFDQMLQLRPKEPVDTRIVIVEINEADIRAAGQWPMSDALLAKLLQTIKRQKPIAIGLDLFRDLPVEPGHEELVQVFKSTPNLIGVQKLVGDANSAAVSAPPALKQQGQVASNDMILDADGKIRRSLLYLTLADGQPVLSFGMHLALLSLKDQGIGPEVKGNQLQLGSVVFPPFSANDGGYVRADDRGYQVLLNYRGAARSFQQISMTEVLNDRVPARLFQGRIVLIGSTAESLKDLFYTPYSSTLLGIPERMAGVEIHANLLSQILSTVQAGRPLMRTWPEQMEWAWIVAWTLLGAMLSWRQRLRKGQERSPRAMTYLLLSGVGLVLGCYGALVSGWWIPVVPALVGMVGATIAITSHTALTAAKIRETLGRYVDDGIVASLLETPEGLKLGGEKRKVTVLISDIRGFSALSEELPPEQLVTLLNLYLGRMADIIVQYEGVIEAFIGDGIVVVFGLPAAQQNDAERAVACAISMQRAMAAVNGRNLQLNLPAIEMGIGINTGEVVVGNIGSARRTKYGVIGRNVNLAARVESYTVGGQILITDSTRSEAGPLLELGQTFKVEPKGIKEPITIYELTGIKGPYNLALPEAEGGLMCLSRPIPIEIAVLEGKHLVGGTFAAFVVKLSASQAEIQAEQTIDPLSDIKIILKPTLGAELPQGDLYAKVLGPLPDNQGFSARFTATPTDFATYIGRWLV